ncbi:MAG: hypothetical protein AB7S83_04260 [Candidatus Methanomethylophilaceae archaeon]
MDATDTQRRKSGPSALLLLALVAAVVALIALAVYALTFPGVLESLLMTGLVILGAAVAVIVIVYVVMLIIAVPMYAYKGESYQKDVSYDLEGVKSVKEKSSEDDEKQEHR